MKKSRILGLCLVFALCVLTAGCFSIEQEIFLNADGSGELVLHMSLPDFPEDMKNAQPGPKTNPEDSLKQFQTDVLANLPPAVKLKEVKEVHQNGAQGFYAVFQFKQIKDVQSVLANFGKQGLKDTDLGGSKNASVWTVQAEKGETKTSYIQSFYLDLTEPEKKEPAKEPSDAAKPGEPEKEEAGSKELEAQLKPVFLALIKLRFVLHAPAPITDSNADIVMNGSTATWDCSLAAFLNSKKPIEMKASY